jgi:hypothetical protein
MLSDESNRLTALHLVGKLSLDSTALFPLSHADPTFSLHVNTLAMRIVLV